ncbi:MAG: DNA polymerase IV [Clostridiales bacterium]|nr:DNA polymerase IV [Clostridiales bacterium]
MDKIILHCDLNNFYASVECLLNPDLRELPIAVAGNKENRHGVVLAKNELAKSYGVKTGDVIWQAEQKCPGLRVVPPHYDHYMKYSDEAFKTYLQYTDMVEAFGSDECWLDVTGSTRLFGSGKQIADAIRARIKAELGLTLSVGVSFNKVFAKLGSDLKKPDATTEITRENFKSKIWHLPASDMLMVGKKTSEKLKKLNIHTIGDLAAADEHLLTSHFGVIGKHLILSARGEDSEPVRKAHISREVKSVGHGMTAVRDITTLEDGEALIFYLSDLVATRMRKQRLKGSGVSVHVRYADLSGVTKQAVVPPLNTSDHITKAAFELYKPLAIGRVVRAISVAVYNLCPDEFVQTSMFDVTDTKSERLEKAIDKIRSKYGKSAINRALLVERDFIYDKTDGEDFLPFKR